MAKFSDETIRFLKSEEELTWKVPENYQQDYCGENVTVHYNPLLMEFESGEIPHRPNTELHLVATFRKNESVIGKLFLREPSPVNAAPSLPRSYRSRSNINLRTTSGFWYESLIKGQIALKRAREMLKAKCIPDCQTGDFDSLFNVVYVEVGGCKGWIRYRPLTDSWETVTFHDDESITTIDLTGDDSERSDFLCRRPAPRNPPVEVTPAMRDQEASTSGASARVPLMTGDEEARVPHGSHETAPDLPATVNQKARSPEALQRKKPETSNQEVEGSADSKSASQRKNAKQRLKNKIKNRMNKYYPHLKWTFENPEEMTIRFEVDTEPTGEEEQRKMMDIKNEIQALFKQLKPGSSVELPNPKLP